MHSSVVEERALEELDLPTPCSPPPQARGGPRWAASLLSKAWGGQNLKSEFLNGLQD